MGEAPLLEIKGLGKRFAARQGREPSPWVIQGLSFSVQPGEFLTIVGPSGAGKSTLLNMIAQIDTVSRARSCSTARRWHRATRVPASGLRPARSHVTQDDNLLPWRTISTTCCFRSRCRGASTPRRGRTPKCSSRGRARRLRALLPARAVGRHAQACGTHPHAGLRPARVILMDEPFAAVDAQTRAQLQADLLRLWNLKRKTIIFVTHDITEAIALGDRALVLSRQPARIAAEHTIPIPRLRKVEDIFAVEGFATVYERIRAAIQ